MEAKKPKQRKLRKEKQPKAQKHFKKTTKNTTKKQTKNTQKQLLYLGQAEEDFDRQKNERHHAGGSAKIVTPSLSFKDHKLLTKRPLNLQASETRLTLGPGLSFGGAAYLS